MKKLVLAITVAAFTVGAYAGDKCCPDKKTVAGKTDEAAACATKTAAACTETTAAAKGTCPLAAKKAKQSITKVESPRGAEASKSTRS